MEWQPSLAETQDWVVAHEHKTVKEQENIYLGLKLFKIKPIADNSQM